MELTHRNVCLKAARYLRSQGIKPFQRCNYSVCELERAGESPDAFGFNSVGTQLIEVKVSRSDFLSDKRKRYRKFPWQGLGNFRSYLCPDGLIKPEELPEKWGLLYINERGNISIIKKPEYQDSCKQEELNLCVSLLRREGIKPQMFNYKKYKDDQNSNNSTL